MNKLLLPMTLFCLALLAVITVLPDIITAGLPPPPGVEAKARWWTGDLSLVPLSAPRHSGSLQASPTPAHRTPSSPSTITDPSTTLTADLPNWSRIAFQSYRDGNWEIYLARGDGTQPVRLTDYPAADVRPRLNRGATRLAFTSDRDGNLEIYAMNTDGSSLARLTFHGASDSSPAWSPDGRRIAFTSDRDGNREIYTMNADGSGLTRLTHEGADDLMPAWSPDGSRIAWVRRSSGYDGVLWVMNADGGDARPLTGPLRFLQNPVWRPYGNTLAFDYDADGDFWNELAIIGVDGTFFPQTMYDPSQDLVDAWMGSWSPDGEWLLFSRVEYVIQDDELFFRYTAVERIKLWNWWTERVIASGYDMLPDWQTADILPPVARVHRLPRLSHAKGFTVAWSGADEGPAGVQGYEVQYRDGTSGAWTTWLADTKETSALFTGTPGHTYGFRARAWDYANNYQSWQSDRADAETTLYTWKVIGSVWDIRGRPIPNAPLGISPEPLFPAVTRMDGRYQAYMQQEKEHALTVTRPGYGSAPPMILDLTADAMADHVLPPADNQIRNGGFEEDDRQLTDWITARSTVATPAATTILRHTGRVAASLGVACPFPCLSDPEPVWDGLFLSLPNVAVDSVGNVHAVWGSSGYPGPGPVVYYGFRTVHGTWVGPRLIGNTGDYHHGVQPGLAIDGHDTLHAAWSGEAGLYYSQRPAAGDWTSPIVIAQVPNHLAAIAADSKGGVHVVYRCASSVHCPPRKTPLIYYLEKSPSGTWHSPHGLDSGQGYAGPGIAVGPDDTIHFVWQETGTGIFYQARLPDGGWTEREKLFDVEWGYSYERQRIAVAANGAVHVVWNWPYQVYYTSRPPGSTWSTPVTLPQADGAADLAVDRLGVVHLLTFWSRTSEEKVGTYYRRKAPEADWIDPVRIGHGMGAIAIDRYDLVHMMILADQTLVYQGMRRSDQAGTSSISQNVTIPGNLHWPTLSAMYQLHGGAPGGNSGFEMLVTDELTTTQVFLATTGAPWSLAWADLQPWAGQTVTITLAARQEIGDPHVHLFLDDVSLGSWLTPVIHEVSPSRVEPWTAASITVAGQNFIATPSLRLDERPLDDVQWVDERTLTATLPADLPPGVYDVWVANPGGQEAVLPGGLRAGWQVYLPLLLKGYTP